MLRRGRWNTCFLLQLQSAISTECAKANCGQILESRMFLKCSPKVISASDEPGGPFVEAAAGKPFDKPPTCTYTALRKKAGCTRTGFPLHLRPRQQLGLHRCQPRSWIAAGSGCRADHQSGSSRSSTGRRNNLARADGKVMIDCLHL